MVSGRALCGAVFGKTEEQVERTAHLIRRLPADGGTERIPGLLGHLLDCMAGVCAVLAAAEPVRLSHFAALRGRAVNHACTPSAALERIEEYRRHIVEGFGVLCDADLARPIPTVFVPEGEPLLTLLLGNLEHLINHKHQLFILMQQMGIQVNSRDLYRFRGSE